MHPLAASFALDLLVVGAGPAALAAAVAWVGRCPAAGRSEVRVLSRAGAVGHHSRNDLVADSFADNPADWLIDAAQEFAERSGSGR